MIAILDYKAGNQTSVKRALDYLGIPNVITANPEAMARAAGVIFPGVGAAGSAMSELNETGLSGHLHALAASGKPILGICVGCQVMLEHSAENDTATLGIYPGRCLRFDPELKDFDGLPIRVPHMGWNSLTLKQDCVLFDGVDPDSAFYFVHSYYPAPAPELVIATTHYGTEFCSVLGRPGLWATQFHPEKSGRPGLRILQNFNRYAQEAANAQ